MPERISYASCSIEPATGWSAEICVDSGPGEELEYLAIVPEGKDASLRLTTDDLARCNVDAVTWIEAVRHCNRAKGRPVSAVQCGDFAGYVVEFEAIGEWLRGWTLRAGAFPLCACYRCKIENAGRDDSAVEGMLKTLRFGGFENRGGRFG